MKMPSKSAIFLILTGCVAAMTAVTYGATTAAPSKSPASPIGDPKIQSVAVAVSEKVTITALKNETDRMLLAGLSHLTSGLGNTLGGMLSHNNHHGGHSGGSSHASGSMTVSSGHDGAAQLSSGSNIAEAGQLHGGIGGPGGSHVEVQSSFGNQGAGQFGSQNSGQFSNQMNGQADSQGNGQFAQQGSHQAGMQSGGQFIGQAVGQFSGQAGGQMGYQGSNQYSNQMNGQFGVQGNGQFGGQSSGNFNGQFGGNGNGQMASMVAASSQPLCTCRPGQSPVTGGMNVAPSQQAPVDVNLSELIRQGRATTVKRPVSTKKQNVKG